ncbi:hypothetical protein [Capnocytophaga ochracea]|uniref:hypothetical protein n=1 Tax=Capnocytophaga ochracea TaxID=1018 RepID=UPI002B49CDDF|nr:hypothetical protein [Capnocytophaga ochracea]MEB3035995.1 hypothetical protein [Capnocytophaga ochracea]
MAIAQLTVELSSINTDSLLEELSERLDSSYYRSKIKNWIKDVYTDLVYNDDLFFLEEISIIDKEKFEFFYKNYKDISLEQLEQLAK